MDTRRAMAMPVLALALAAVAAVPAVADEPEKPPAARKPTERDYLAGAALASSQDLVGTEGRRLRLQPLWSFQVGRFRVSSSRAAALWQLGRQPLDPGVSVAVVQGEKLSLSTSLQYDGGRRSSSDALFQGLPDIRNTLRGRVSARYAIDEQWSVRAVWSADLLGRDGGATLSPSLHYRRPLTRQTQLDVSAGAVWGSGTHLRTHYGIAPAVAAGAGRAAFVPGAGWSQWQLGAEVSTALGPRWVAFAGLGYTALAGDARRSPLVTHTGAWGASVGLAYRCC